MSIVNATLLCLIRDCITDGCAPPLARLLASWYRKLWKSNTSPESGSTYGILARLRSALSMSAVRPVSTRPEKAVRKELSRLGYRYRLNRYDLPGRPDIVFPGRRKVIFVHGCFWHRHQGYKQSTTPVRNRDLWRKKFAATTARDRRHMQSLGESGWEVLTLWECEIRDPESLTHTLNRFVQEGGNA